MIHVLADQNLYKISEFLPEKAHLTLYDPADGLPALDGFDALIVQTVTKLNASTLPNPPEQLKFIGTGSSGIDHIDRQYYELRGIKVVNAKGCNANTVGEYVITALLLWMNTQNINKSLKVGVIGAGSAGSAVMDLLNKFSIDFVAYDPPLEETDPRFRSASLEEVLDCNILTFHVPLTVKGNYSTYHWLNEEKLKSRNFDLIINASRGGVIDEEALFTKWQSESVGDFILDVWDNEPDFDIKIAEKAFIATPHIAGYSEQAKIKATHIVCSALSEFFNLPLPGSNRDHIQKRIEIPQHEKSLSDIISHLHPMLQYDSLLRSLMHKEDKSINFSKLRNDFPFRFEFPFLEIRHTLLQKYHELQKLGIAGY